MQQLIHQLVGRLMGRAADPFDRGPVFACLPAGSTELELLVPPPAVTASTLLFLELGLSAICRDLLARKAVCAGLLLPVVTRDREIEICPVQEADAMLIVAAEDAEVGVASAGVICSLRGLPEGWREVHADVQWLARPLREALAHRPLAGTESPLPG